MCAVQARPPLIDLLAHDIRWSLIAALTRSDRRVQELVAIVDRPMNLVSYHLRLLREGQLVQERRSSADARDIYYSLNLDEVATQFREMGVRLHLGFAPDVSPTSAPELTTPSPISVLFLCTHNSARSQIAEGLLRRMGGASVIVASAGTEPSQVHPLAIQVMQESGIDITEQSSTHLDQFTSKSFDYIITVCDKAREECPVFPGDPHQIHWSIPDPVAVVGDEETRTNAFLIVQKQLTTRLRHFLAAVNRAA